MYNYSSSISWIFIVSFLYGPDAENLLHDHTYDESRAVWKQWRMKLPLLTTRGSSAWIPVRWGPFICGHSSVSCSTLLTYDVSLSANLGGAFSLMVQHRRRCFTQITCEKIKGMRCRFQDEKSLRTPQPSSPKRTVSESIRFHTLPRNDLILERGYLRKKVTRMITISEAAGSNERPWGWFFGWRWTMLCFLRSGNQYGTLAEELWGRGCSPLLWTKW